MVDYAVTWGVGLVHEVVAGAITLDGLRERPELGRKTSTAPDGLPAKREGSSSVMINTTTVIPAQSDWAVATLDKNGEFEFAPIIAWSFEPDSALPVAVTPTATYGAVMVRDGSVALRTPSGEYVVGDYSHTVKEKVALAHLRQATKAKAA
jgi:hypothetical protein